VSLMDRGKNVVTLKGRGPTAKQRASYDKEIWDRVRRGINMDVDRRASHNHGRDMTFDVTPPDMIAYGQGVYSAGRGLVRCMQYCGEGLDMLHRLYKNPQTSMSIANEIARLAIENPEYTVGRASPGAITYLAAGFMTKNPSWTASASSAIGFGAVAGDLGYYSNVVKSAPNSQLTDQDLVDIVTYGFIARDKLK